MKAAAVIAATLAIGRYLASRKFGLPGLVERAQAAVAQVKKRLTIVSDVDGHSQCRMRVTVIDGKVVEIHGDAGDPEGKGQLTARDKYMTDLLYAPDRLKYPVKRAGERGEGKWERISWDEALTAIANKLKEIKKKHGAEAIDFHRGHHHSGDFGAYLVRLANLMGTPNVSTTSHVCHMPRVFLQYYFDFGVVPPDVAHTSCIIIWGGNPKTSNKPQEIAIQEARERGAKLLVVDSRVTPYAEEADLHAQLRPGTDGALALSMLNVIIKEGLYDREFIDKWSLGFERLAKHTEDYPPEKVEEITWVPAEKIRKIARMYATTKPACISPRNALDHHTNASGAIRAINILMAITGNLDVRGRNVISIPIMTALRDIKLYEDLPSEVMERRIGADKYLWSKMFNVYPSTHTPSLWDAIIHGKPYPIKAMFVTAANPALIQADSNVVQEALRKLEFLAVADMFMTPTAELADIVLPACNFFEKTRCAMYETHADHWWNEPSRIALSPKVVEPLWESWSDWKIICELGRKMGYRDCFPWKTEEEAIDHVLEPLGITCEELRDHPEGIVIPLPPFLYKKFSGFFGGTVRGILTMTKFREYPMMYKKYEAAGFMTPSKKVEIYSERLEKLGYDPLPVFREPAESPVSRPDLAGECPLILIAGTKLEAYTHSMMRNIPKLRELAPENLLEIHLKTATELRIKDGNSVNVRSPRGGIKCRAKVTDRIDPRVVHLYHGFKEANCNVLTDHKACDSITGSTGLKSLLRKVEKIQNNL